MSYWRPFLSLLIAALLAASNVARAEGAEWEQFDKWWPMCVFDGSGGGNVNSAVTEMVKMAAKCKVNLDVRPYSIPPGTGAGNVKKLTDDARAKCNLTDGFGKMGVNRGSVLILGSAATAQQMCKATTADNSANRNVAMPGLIRPGPNGKRPAMPSVATAPIPATTRSAISDGYGRLSTDALRFRASIRTSGTAARINNTTTTVQIRAGSDFGPGNG